MYFKRLFPIFLLFGYNMDMSQANKNKKTLEEMIRELPSSLKDELLDFAHFLWEKKMGSIPKNAERKLRLDWAGGLKEWRDEYTSVELQDKAKEWMIKDAFAIAYQKYEGVQTRF